MADVSDIFYLFFSARGRGRGSPRCWEGGGCDSLLKIPGGGGSHGRVGAGGRGAGRVFAGNWGGGGLNIFFRGRNSHQEKHRDLKSISTAGVDGARVSL